MSKAYPLEIENVGEDDYIVMSRGHHDPHEFMKAVRRDYDWPLGMPTHRWVKQTPARDGFSYHFVKEGTRGAFPATYSHEAYGDRRYEAICAATATQPAQTERALPDDAIDAARYRWLRRQHWNEAGMFVVAGSKSQVRLGTDCPSLVRLDDAIDAAIAAQPASGDKL